MNEYTNYKEWWKKMEAPSKVPSYHYGLDVEGAFEQHVEDLGLYGLMETLEMWREE
jgi:hypothetical protein